MYISRIKGLGFYIPDNVVTNDDLSKLMGLRPLPRWE